MPTATALLEAAANASVGQLLAVQPDDLDGAWIWMLEYIARVAQIKAPIASHTA